jgi:hypothetical protein
MTPRLGKIMPAAVDPRSPKWWDLSLNGLKSVCDKLPAISIDKTYLLVLFSADDRPQLDRINAMLINLESQEVADINIFIGSYFDQPIEIIPSGLRAKVAQGWLKHGHSDGPENLLLGWKTIQVGNGKLSSHWEKPLLAISSIPRHSAVML